MIRHLHIENYALIEHLDMEFHTGFSVITGETGAGKSIVLGAIGLLMGQRADTKAIKTDAQKCSIEAHFNLSAYDMQEWFDENEIDFDADDFGWALILGLGCPMVTSEGGLTLGVRFAIDMTRIEKEGIVEMTKGAAYREASPMKIWSLQFNVTAYFL